MVALQFQITRVADDSVVVSVPKDEIVVEEDGVKVAGLEIFQPRAHKLTTVLASCIDPGARPMTRMPGRPSRASTRRAWLLP